MKNYLKTFALCILVLSVSCEKNKIENPDQVNQALEKTPLEANAVANNVIIEGGTKETGTPPTPNEAISLDISSSSSIALLGEGFEVSLDSDAAITGAYLIFKSTDDTVADGYYDIDLSANTAGKNVVKEKKSTLSILSKAKVEENLDVDFNAEIEPGTFCYEICVYDDAGNISAPQELCVTVESWGGFSDLNGEWSFTKYEEDENGDGITSTITAGKKCEDVISGCEPDGSVPVKYQLCESFSGKLIFNADGTYSYESVEEINDGYIDESCMVIEDNTTITYTSSGNWAYNAEEKKLIVVEYSYVDLEESSLHEDEQDQDTYALGDGELLYYGTASISNGTLTIFETYEDEPEYASTSYWDKQ